MDGWAVCVGPPLDLDDNNLNGAHDFNDLCLDDYGIYVLTPTSTTGRTTKSTLTSSTMATTTRKQQQNDDLFEFNVRHQRE